MICMYFVPSPVPLFLMLLLRLGKKCAEDLQSLILTLMPYCKEPHLGHLAVDCNYVLIYAIIASSLAKTELYIRRPLVL